MSEKNEAAKKKAAEEAAAKAKAGADAEAGKDGDAQLPNKKPVPPPDAPGKRPVRVTVCRSLAGERFYGEDWGDGKLIDKATGKRIVAVERDVKVKRRDPENPKVTRTVTIQKTDFELK